MLVRRGAIPATANSRRPPPRVQPHVGHCDNRLRHCEACKNGAPPCLPLCPVRIDVSNTLEHAWGTSRPTIAFLPSKLPLFGYKIRHDDQIAARTVKAAAYSTVGRTIPPYVA
jgi:hypothetical protein